jgi:tetraacyldisaccharide 4'-kinase
MLRRALARTYAGIASLRRLGYERGLWRRARLPVPVISIGALRLGGSGKTPVAGYVAALLTRRGRSVGVVHRGYGATSHEVTRVGPEDSGLLVGDEAVLHARWSPEAIVVRGADKEQAARLAVAAGADVIVLDDGFQHLQLHRDLDIVLCDEEPVMPLPLGAGREGRSALASADLLWAHGRAGLPPRGAFDVTSRARPSDLVSPSGQPIAPASSLAGARVFLLAAVARPKAFVRICLGLGATIVGTRFLRDHRPIGPVDLGRAARSGADLVVCTEKDLARQGQSLTGVVALRCEVRLEHGAVDLEQALDVACGRRVSASPGSPR